jgi:hypothetical protein
LLVMFLLLMFLSVMIAAEAVTLHVMMCCSLQHLPGVLKQCLCMPSWYVGILISAQSQLLTQ